MLHEERGQLSAQALDMKRAIDSLREELEAIDWYNQRAEIATDEELRGILAHNRDEEKEHAAMLIEWVRRNMDNWDKELHDYIFSTAPLGAHEAAGEAAPSASKDLGIGKL